MIALHYIRGVRRPPRQGTRVQISSTSKLSKSSTHGLHRHAHFAQLQMESRLRLLHTLIFVCTTKSLSATLLPSFFPPAVLLSPSLFSNISFEWLIQSCSAISIMLEPACFSARTYSAIDIWLSFYCLSSLSPRYCTPGFIDCL